MHWERTKLIHEAGGSEEAVVAGLRRHPGVHHRRATAGSYGGGVSYERGTPVSGGAALFGDTEADAILGVGFVLYQSYFEAKIPKSTLKIS